MQDLTRHVSTRATPQTEPIPGEAQVQNRAGGYVYGVDEWTRLERFLILGTEGGTYYATEKTLTVEAAKVVFKLAASDGEELVRRIVAISEGGRAPKNDPALFALAIASAQGSLDGRRAAYEALPRVARTGTHLFTFLTYRQAFGGWGRGLRRAVSRWYTEKDLDRLAYQLIKYRQREGWTHRDVLRKAHPQADEGDRDNLFSWVVSDELDVDIPVDSLPKLIQGFELAQRAETPAATAGLVAEYGLPREALQTEHLTDPVVWEALVDAGMPMTALIRNLATMTRIGLVAPMSDVTQRIVAQLQDGDRLQKARVHPLAVLSALVTYKSGQSARGSSTWTPVREIVDALDEAFYASFGFIEGTGKRIMLAIDISGSMAWPQSQLARIPGLYARDAAAAMAMVTARSESQYLVTAFSGGIVPVDISPRQRLDDVVQAINRLPAGRTDCALPMLAAIENGRHDLDAFVVYTDNETWYGRPHPKQALEEYRQRSGRDAKLVVVGMVANEFSIADPADAGMLDVVGFDTSAPNVMSEFIVK